MKRFIRISSSSLILLILSLFIATPVQAIPPLPSSFWGMVKVNGVDVSNGTLIQALVGEQIYAEGYIQVYQGDSFYALDVRGDDVGTTILDGAIEGDTIQFKVGGLFAEQTAVWHGGTNVNLDLTVISSESINTPQATPTSLPTQTAIIVVTSSVQPEATSTTEADASLMVTKSPQPLLISTQPPSTRIPATNNEGETTSHQSGAAVVISLVLAVLMPMGFKFWSLIKNKN
jgi:hypothetical protein